MRLTYIANARIPTEKAHGIHIMQMCEALANSAEVELVIPDRHNPLKEDPFGYYGIERNFKIIKLPCLDLIPFHKYLGHFGLWVESVTFSISLFLYILLKSADIFYARDKYALPLSFFKKNFILEIHTFPKHYNLYAPFLKKVKKIVVITQGLKNLFAGKGISEDKLLVAPDGVDLQKFEIRNTKSEIRGKLGLPRDKKIVLYTGHLYGWKGVQTLAEASQLLPEEAEVYFVGGTAEDIKKFRLQVAGCGLQVMVVGHRPHSEIPYWLKAADVLVLPNSGKEDISKYWTSPLKMFEYMASSSPIVASDLLSIGEILNKENAVMVEPDNPRSLAEGIKKVLQDQSLSDRISAKAFQDVQQYAWAQRVNKILAFANR